MHELMIDSGCYGHVCPPWFAPQFPLVDFTNIGAVTANNATRRHYGRKVVYGHATTNRGRQILIQITFDVMSVRKPLLSTSALKRRGVTIIFNHELRPHYFSKRDSEFDFAQLSYLPASHTRRWNSSSQSDDDDWRERDKCRGRRSLRR